MKQSHSLIQTDLFYDIQCAIIHPMAKTLFCIFIDVDSKIAATCERHKPHTGRLINTSKRNDRIKAGLQRMKIVVMRFTKVND